MSYLQRCFGFFYLNSVSSSLNATYRVRTGFGKFWKVMEIENVFFQDLENFGKGRIFKMAMEMFWIFVRKNSKTIQK